MNKRLDKLIDFVERHKYGILVTLLLHVGAFVCFQVITYKKAVFFEPWDFRDKNEQAPDNIVITPDQIQTIQEARLLQPQKVSSFVKNENDSRKRSTQQQNYTSSTQNTDYKKEQKEYIENLKNKILGKDFGKKDGNTKSNEEQTGLETKHKESSDKNSKNRPSSSEAIGGATLVSYSLAHRYPHQHNDWYVRNPGYTCGNVNGVVVVAITVGKGGKVVNAKILEDQSQNASQCMLRQAKKYALLSRFNYSSNAPSQQDGTITYRFVYNQ